MEIQPVVFCIAAAKGQKCLYIDTNLLPFPAHSQTSRLISLFKTTEEMPNLGFNPGSVALKSALLALCHIERNKGKIQLQ